MANNTFPGKQPERFKLSDKYGNDLNGVVKVARLIAAAASDNPIAVGAASANSSLRRIQGYNAKASVVYIKIYDKLAAPSSADTPIMSIPLAASSNFSIPLEGIRITNGIGYRIVTGSADNDNTAVSANDIVGMNLFYDV